MAEENKQAEDELADFLMNHQANQIVQAPEGLSREGKSWFAKLQEKVSKKLEKSSESDTLDPKPS